MRIDRSEAFVVLLRLHQLGFGNRYIRLGLIDVGQQYGKLRIGLLQTRRSAAPLRLRLIDLRLIVARVDHDQDLTRRNVLIVGELQRDDGSRHLRRQLCHLAVDERIVGGREMPRVQPIDGAGTDQRDGDDGRQGDAERAPPTRWPAIGLPLCPLCHAARSRAETG